MAKQNANLTTLGQIQSSLDAYLSAVMISAPNTIVTDLAGVARQIKDPSKTLRLSFGTERITPKNIEPKVMEKGPAGEQVWGLINDDRIRLVGTWVMEDIGNGTQLRTSTIGDIIEITFFGTGLNYVLQADNTVRTMSASVDGAAYGANFYNSTYDDSQQGRNTATNNPIPVASGLTLGVHTVKIRLDSGANARVYGFEVVNNSSLNITLPAGEVINAGRKDGLAALTAFAYNTSFDGNPTLNGFGGRVQVYLKDGYLGKAIQQTNAVSQYMAAADHTNEEVIRRINWREFGAGRADDFSTIAAVAVNRFFTLQDATTTLVGQTVVANFTQADVLNLTNTIGTSYVILTFVGTGLDAIVCGAAAGAWNTLSVFIDNVNQGTVTGSGPGLQVVKLASGLPYGTHTVRLQALAAQTVNTGITDFIIYGPKAPSLPANSVKIGEYYLVSNFIANSTAGILTLSQGTIRKHASREFLYRGNTWGVNTSQISFIGGLEWGTNTNGDSISYTFFGTGFDFRGQTSTAGMATLNVTMNGTALTSANFPTAASTSYGGYAFALATGILDSNNSSTIASGWSVSNLPLAMYTLTITSTSAGSPGFQVDAIDIITPVHFPDSTMRVGNLTASKSLPFTRSGDQGNLALSRAKAWVWYDGANQLIYSSYNINGVVKSSTGNYEIYFEKPFKNANYVTVSSPGGTGNTNFYATKALNQRPGTTRINLTFTTNGAATDTDIFAVFFGELADEDSE